jgi:hypothetical protein
MAKLKANFMVVKEDNNAQMLLIYKAKTFICRNMRKSFCKIVTKIVKGDSQTICEGPML